MSNLLGTILACVTFSENGENSEYGSRRENCVRTAAVEVEVLGDRSLEMAIPVPVPPTYRGLSGEEAAEAEEDFYYNRRFHVFVLTGEEGWACLRTLAEDKRAKGSGSRRWEYNSVVRGKLDSSADSHPDIEGQNSPVEPIFKMGRSSVDKVSTSGRTNESDSGGEGGLEQFLCFPDLEAKKRDRGIDKSILFKYFDGDVRSDLLEGFMCYLSQLEYGLSLPLTNLVKGVMNAIGAYPVQMNENLWEVITVYNHLNDRWEREKKVRRITPENVLQFYGVKIFKASGESNLCACVTRPHFFDLNSAGVKSTVEKKKSLLDEVTEEETELELVLGELGLSRKKRVESSSKKIKKTFPASGTTVSSEVAQGKMRRVKPLGGSGEKVAEGRFTSVDDLKEVEERGWLAILQGKEDTSQMIARLVKGIWLGIEEQESGLKKAKSEQEKDLARAKTDALKEAKQLKGYSLEEVDTIKANTYIEKEEEEAKVLGVVDGLDGISPQMVLDNQGDDVELPEGGSEKAELDASRVSEDHTLMCNREFAEQFDRMKEANENREDQYVKAYFRLEKLN
ncbi:hypothetical protein GIB67_010364 [Kingdonia uniflora]|uniref:Uncharacterized protein n=1 Tax=Kingdonia uniflora TaxID=39325 RepID=A0A7J7MAI9_9MAGN|nr:hypothetical protein GIB67_010364 [Kingdonia uniflora]